MHPGDYRAAGLFFHNNIRGDFPVFEDRFEVAEVYLFHGANPGVCGFPAEAVEGLPGEDAFCVGRFEVYYPGEDIRLFAAQEVDVDTADGGCGAGEGVVVGGEAFVPDAGDEPVEPVVEEGGEFGEGCFEFGTPERFGEGVFRPGICGEDAVVEEGGGGDGEGEGGGHGFSSGS